MEANVCCRGGPSLGVLFRLFKRSGEPSLRRTLIGHYFSCPHTNNPASRILSVLSLRELFGFIFLFVFYFIGIFMNNIPCKVVLCLVAHDFISISKRKFSSCPVIYHLSFMCLIHVNLGKSLTYRCLSKKILGGHFSFDVFRVEVCLRLQKILGSRILIGSNIVLKPFPCG